VAVLLNLILPDHEIVPKEEPDVDIEAQPVERTEDTKEESDSLTGSDKRK